MLPELSSLPTGRYRVGIVRLRERAVAKPDRDLSSDSELCVNRRADHDSETASREARDEMLDYMETDVRNRPSGIKVTFRMSKALPTAEPQP